ncbi:MAG: hypothetical protein EOO36_13200, partial [Cytophagaceae bacterium]
MRKKLTRKLGLTLAGLLPLAALHAQSLEPQAAFAKALAARAQWDGTSYPAADLRLSSAYAETGGLEHVYVQQLYRGIPVYNRMQSLAFKGDRLAAHAGNFIAPKQLAALSAKPTVSAAAAVSLALKHLEAANTGTPALLKMAEGPEAQHTFAGAGVARHDIVASLTWAFDAAQRPHLAWNVNIDLLGTPDWWNVRIDATTGNFVDQDNWTVSEAAGRPAASAAARAVGYQPLATVLALAPPPPPTTTTSSYLVVPFPRERPTAAQPLQTETDPWLKAGTVNNATTNGWHFDG